MYRAKIKNRANKPKFENLILIEPLPWIWNPICTTEQQELPVYLVRILNPMCQPVSQQSPLKVYKAKIKNRGNTPKFDKLILMEPVFWMKPNLHHKQAPAFFIAFGNAQNNALIGFSDIAFRSAQCKHKKPRKQTQILKIYFDVTSVVQGTKFAPQLS